MAEEVAGAEAEAEAASVAAVVAKLGASFSLGETEEVVPVVVKSGLKRAEVKVVSHLCKAAMIRAMDVVPSSSLALRLVLAVDVTEELTEDVTEGAAVVATSCSLLPRPKGF